MSSLPAVVQPISCHILYSSYTFSSMSVSVCTYVCCLTQYEATKVLVGRRSRDRSLTRETTFPTVHVIYLFFLARPQMFPNLIH